MTEPDAPSDDALDDLIGPEIFDRVTTSVPVPVPKRIRLGGPRWTDTPTETVELPDDPVVVGRVPDPRMKTEGSGIYLVVFEVEGGYRVLVRGYAVYLPEENFAFFSGRDNVVPDIIDLHTSGPDEKVSLGEKARRFEALMPDLQGEVLSWEEVEAAYPQLAAAADQEGAE